MRDFMRKGFTLSEVLITLGIIGIVAALTIPSLVSAYQKHVVEEKLKQAYSILVKASRMAQVDPDSVIPLRNSIPQKVYMKMINMEFLRLILYHICRALLK